MSVFDAPARTGRDPDAVLRSHLAERLGPARFDRCFADARVRVADDGVEITAASTFSARLLEADLRDEVAAAAHRAFGREVPVTIRAEPRDAGSPPEAPAPVHHDRPVRRPDAAPRTPLRSLDALVIGPCNELAVAAGRRLAESSDPGLLVVHGDCGVGKTHVLQGACRLALSRGLGPVRYVTAEQFTNEYIVAVRDGRLESFRARYRRPGLLAIDDVHFLASKVRTQSEFLHTLDALQAAGARILLATDQHPRRLERFGRPLLSRLLAGMVVEMDRPDRDTRRAIATRLAHDRGLAMRPEALERLVARVPGSVRELEGAVAKLGALCSLLAPEEGGAGVAIVDRLFDDQANAPRVPVRIGHVIDAVCARLDVSRSDLAGRSRHRRIVLARALVAWLGRDLTAMSFPELARAIGRTTHSSVHAAARRMADAVERDETLEIAGPADRVPATELVECLRRDARRVAVHGPA